MNLNFRLHHTSIPRKRRGNYSNNNRFSSQFRLLKLIASSIIGESGQLINFFRDAFYSGNTRAPELLIISSLLRFLTFGPRGSMMLSKWSTMEWKCGVPWKKFISDKLFITLI